MIKFLLILSSFLIIHSSINAMTIDNFNCKIPTCRDFFSGLKHHPRRREYEKICFETVYTLQAIPRNHGKCINERTGKLNPQCIYALAETIKTCINQLNDLTDYQARYYCGYTLMKYCAVHVGLDGYPQRFDAPNL